MILSHEDYLNYELPNNWCTELEGDILLIYDPDGDGSMTISFFNLLEHERTLDEQISIMAKRFIDQNKINLHAPLILNSSTDNKTTIYGTGTTADNWFIKLWVIAKWPKIVFASYQSQNKSNEVKTCDGIIESMRFTF
ncbi:MAG: hypothetical protein Q4D35_06775 [Ruminococcus sp.]|nr:hypothetical protein [Ruminococcus sp.]